MSTVVYKDGVMACDTQTTNGSEFQTGVSKIGRTKKFLFGYCGRLGGLRPAFEWVLNCEDQNFSDETPEDFYKYADQLVLDDEDGTMLLANRAGRVWSVTTSGLYVIPHPRGWEAIGSGGAYACGALMYGASAGESVDVAMQLDSGTGGDLRTLFFLPEETDQYPIVYPGLIDA